MKVKKNWQVFLTDSRGVDFLGYRNFHKFCLIRKSIAINFKKKMKKIKSMKVENSINSVMSYVGWMQHANTKTLMHKYMEGLYYEK